jgi:hypothetical protein
MYTLQARHIAIISARGPGSQSLLITSPPLIVGYIEQVSPMANTLEAADFDPEAADFDPEATDFDPEAAAFDPEAADFDPEAADFDPEAADFDPEAADFDPEAMAFDPEAMAFDPEAADFNPEAADFNPEATLYEVYDGKTTLYSRGGGGINARQGSTRNDHLILLCRRRRSTPDYVW